MTKTLKQLVKKFVVVNAFAVAIAFQVFAATPPTQFEVTLYPFPEKVSKASPIIELAVKYPDKIDLKIRFAKINEKDFKITDGIYQRLGYFVFLNETNKNALRSITECYDYDPAGHVCTKLINTYETEYAPLQTAYGDKVKAERFDIAKENISESELPYLKLNGQPYKGALAYNQLVAAVNAARPEGEKIPALTVPPTTEIFYIGSEESIKKRNFMQEMIVQKTTPNIEFRTLLSDSEQGKQFLTDAKLVEVPVYLAKPDANKNLYVSGLRAKNKVEDTETGFLKLNLGAPTDKEFVDGATRPNDLTLYVMSQCPYGVKAMNAAIEGKRSGKIKKSVQVNFKYIVSKEGAAWRTLHGQPELDENIRQLTIAKHFPEKHFDYLLERNKNFNSNDWQAVAKKVGIDVATIEKNLQDGEKQMIADAEEVARRGVNASPTVVWENRKILKTVDQAKATLGYNIFKR